MDYHYNDYNILASNGLQPQALATHNGYANGYAEHASYEDDNVNLTMPGQLILKVLIPGYAAGAVIGKGGQIIVQLQKESGAVIKLSKAKDFYPGTQDRVVLIQGAAEGLMKVQNTIIEKVYEFPVPKDLAAIIGDRPKQVKIIVPNTTAGLVIGKSGSTIRTIMEESGSKVQLSQKPDGVTVQERVITIKGEKHQLIAASNIIIDKIKDDPQSASCPHISYSGVVGPVANANPTGSPYAAGSNLVEPTTMLGHFVIPGHNQIVQAALPTSHFVSQIAHATAAAQQSNELNALSAATLANCYTLGGAGLGGTTLLPGLHSLHPSLSAAGLGSSAGLIPVTSLAGSVSPAPSTTPLFSATPLPTDNGLQAATALPATSGVQNAAATRLSFPNGYLTNLANAGFLTTSQQSQLVSPGLTSAINTLAAAQQQQAQQQPPTVSTPSNISMPSAPATPGSTFSQPLTSVHQQPQTHQHHQQVGVSVLSVEKSSDGLKEVIDLAVPENLIGAILGKQGRTLIEYQDISGAKIQISKKGDYVVGTRNRRVSITGRPPCPQTAQYLITQRIASAQTARAQQVKLL